MDQEVLDRVRRIETKLTAWLERHGGQTKSDRPTWADGVVEIPSLDISLRDILTTIPITWKLRSAEDIEVKLKGKRVCWIEPEEMK